MDQKQIQKFWQDSGIYSWNESHNRNDNYVIDTPPPTISGHLHVGHLFSYVQTDFIARYKRMQGFDVFYPMGFDDNGLPTERLVEKIKKVRANKMSRQDFILLCNETVQAFEQDFRALFKDIGLSVDWSLEYQTISANSRALSQASFLQLLKSKKAYRADEPMLFCTTDGTALAQAEVVEKEFETHMNHIKFKISCSQGATTIATTRPELLGACGAIFFHPEDKRYLHLEGKFAEVPLYGFKVPFLADEDVLPEKGTGLVMCCTFGDSTDVMWWRKHKLPLVNIINQYGKIKTASEIKAFDNLNESALRHHEQISGLKVKEARAKIIEILDSTELIEQKKNHITSSEVR